MNKVNAHKASPQGAANKMIDTNAGSEDCSSD
jgi:hypothetical protein